jgi:hypothetical protein
MLELYLTYLILLGAARLLFQLSQLATAIIVGGALMAYVHRKDLASAWLKSFFGLDVQIKGELTLEVEWRAGTNTARLEQPSTLTKLRSILTTLRARYKDGENPISKITCRIRDVRVYAPPPSRPKTEKCLQVDTLVLRFRCPSRSVIPDDGDPRGEARVVLSVAAHNVHLQVAAYDLQFSDTSLTRVLRRVKDTFVARGGKRLKKIRRKDPVHACIVTDRYGEFHVQPFTSSDVAVFEFAVASPAYACVLFERTPTGWRRTSAYGLEYATKVIEARALGDDLGGGLLDEYSSDQNDVSVPRTKRYLRTESVTIARIKVTAAYCEEDAATGLVKRRRPLGTGAIVRHVSAEGLGTRLGFFAWLNRLALKSLASTGLDALNKGVHRVAALLQEDPNEEVETKVSAAKVALRGAADGGGAVLRGITRGAKGAVTSVVRAIRDGDTIEVLSYFCRIADESIGGVLKGATTSLDGVHDGLGAVLDTAAATMTRVPVAGDVAGGGVNAARHVLSAAFGAVRGVVSGAFLGCRAYVRGVIVDRDPLRAMGASSALFASGLADGARDLGGGLARASEDARHGVGRAGRRAGAAFDCLRSAGPDAAMAAPVNGLNGPDDGEADFSSSDSDETPRVDPDAFRRRLARHARRADGPN